MHSLNSEQRMSWGFRPQWQLCFAINVQGGHFPGWHGPRAHGWVHPGRVLEHGASHSSQFFLTRKNTRHSNFYKLFFYLKQKLTGPFPVTAWHGLAPTEKPAVTFKRIPFDEGILISALHVWLVQYNVLPHGRPHEEGTAMWQGQSEVSWPPKHVTGIGTCERGNEYN